MLNPEIERELRNIEAMRNAFDKCVYGYTWKAGSGKPRDIVADYERRFEEDQPGKP